jgi:hypothetical protein
MRARDPITLIAVGVAVTALIAAVGARTALFPALSALVALEIVVRGTRHRRRAH